LPFANELIYNAYNMKKLYRSKESAIASGIFSGLGEWMEVTPLIIRMGYIVLILLTGIIPGIALYLILHFIIPKK
jgi:phage shock protein C